MEKNKSNNGRKEKERNYEREDEKVEEYKGRRQEKRGMENKYGGVWIGKKKIYINQR